MLKVSRNEVVVTSRKLYDKLCICITTRLSRNQTLRPLKLSRKHTTNYSLDRGRPKKLGPYKSWYISITSQPIFMGPSRNILELDFHYKNVEKILKIF